MAIAQSSSRNRPLIVVLVLLSLTLIAVDQAGDKAPTHFLRSSMRDAFAGIGSLVPLKTGAGTAELQKENQQLRDQLDAANGQLSQTDNAAHERDQLVQLLNLPTPNGVPKVIARVTDIGPSNFDSTIEISKGANDGIKAGMPVVTGQGLVGRVIQTSSTRSVVLLMVDTTSNVSVRFSPTSEIGVATGKGNKQNLQVDLIELNSGIKPGDVALTSGVDHSLFPPGIPVGRVKSSTAGPHDTRRDVKLEPIVNPSTLQDVAVLQWQS